MFVDDSIHQEAGFIAVAFVCAGADEENDVAAALIEAGLRPGVDEFKSSTPMNGRPELQRLRKRLRQAIIRSHTPIALLFAAPDRRALAGAVAKALAQLIENNDLQRDQHVYFDQGIFRSAEQLQRLVRGEPALSHCGMHWREDSRSRLGIQLADLVAHAGAYIVKEQMHGPSKTVHLGADSGYGDDGIDVELGGSRRCSFAGTFCARVRSSTIPWRISMPTSRATLSDMVSSCLPTCHWKFALQLRLHSAQSDWAVCIDGPPNFTLKLVRPGFGPAAELPASSPA